MSHLMKKDGGT